MGTVRWLASFAFLCALVQVNTFEEGNDGAVDLGNDASMHGIMGFFSGDDAVPSQDAQTAQKKAQKKVEDARKKKAPPKKDASRLGRDQPARPNITHPFGARSWNRLADALLDCPLARAKDYMYTAKGYSPEEVDKFDIVRVFRTYALDQPGAVERQCERKLPRKELLAVIDMGTNQMFANDLEKKYTPTQQPTEAPAMESTVELLEEAEDKPEPYNDWQARIKAKSLHANMNKPTPGPTYPGGRNVYHIDKLTLSKGWKEFNQTQTQDQPVFRQSGFGAPTLSTRGQVILLEGVVAWNGGDKNSAEVTRLHSFAKPAQDLVFVIQGSQDKNQPGCNQDDTPLMLLQEGEHESGESTALNGGYRITVSTTGAVTVTSDGGLSKWCYISLSGIMYATTHAKKESVMLHNGYTVQAGLTPKIRYPSISGKFGYCFLDGMVNIADPQRPILTTPPGCRPPEPQVFTVQGIGASSDVPSVVLLQLLTDGNLKILHANAGITAFSLAGISVVLLQPPAITLSNKDGRHAGYYGMGLRRFYLHLSNDWDNTFYSKYVDENRKYPSDTNGNVGHDFGNATFTADDDGYCRTQGYLSLRPGLKPQGVIGNFTEDCLPRKPLVFNLQSSEGMALVKVDVNGEIIWLSGSASSVGDTFQEATLTISLDKIAFNSRNHERQTKGLERLCASGRFENKDHPCFKTTWRDVMNTWSGKMVRKAFKTMCWDGPTPIMKNKTVLNDPVAWVDAPRVIEICNLLNSCITALDFWRKAPTWDAECQAQAAQDRTQPVNASILACWSDKVRRGPMSSAAWNPGALQGSDPTVVWKSKKQYEPFSNPCGVMDLQSVKDNFMAWKIPDFPGYPHREPPAGYDPNPMDFEITKGGLYGLSKPLTKIGFTGWETKTVDFGKEGAAEKDADYTKEMENSYCFKNPSLALDADRKCADPSAAFMSVMKKEMTSPYNSTFTKYNFCLTWTAINKDKKKVMQNRAHKELTIPYNYPACEKIFRPTVTYQRARWVCGAADPLPMTPGQDKSSNNETDPVPFLVGAAAGTDITQEVPKPKKFCAHGSVRYNSQTGQEEWSKDCQEGWGTVWQPPSRVKQSCLDQTGSAYRCYKVPKYVCYPGGKMVEETDKNGNLVYEKDGDGQFILMNNMSAPIEVEVNGNMVHRRDENGMFMYKKMRKPKMVHQPGGIQDCLEKKLVMVNGTQQLELVVKKNNWCLNTCIDKDEIARVIQEVEVLRKDSERVNATFGNLRMKFVSLKSVAQDKSKLLEAINMTIGNETQLTKAIKWTTAKYFQAHTYDERIKLAKQMQEYVKQKRAAQQEAEKASDKFRSITEHEESIVKEKEKKYNEIRAAYLKEERFRNETTRKWLDAVDLLETLREKAGTTLANWPAWVKSRWMKIEALPTGSCMFPTRCEAQNPWKPDKILQVVGSALAAQSQGMPAPLEAFQLKLMKPDIWKKATAFISANSGWQSMASTFQSQVPEAKIPGSHFMTTANFCAKEEPADLFQKLDIFRLCEKEAYAQETRCCSSSELKFATALDVIKENTFVVGQTKPWSDENVQEKFTENDLMISPKVKCPKDSPAEAKCGKLSSRAREEVDVLLHEKYHDKYGKHVRKTLSPFNLQEELDLLKDF